MRAASPSFTASIGSLTRDERDERDGLIWFIWFVLFIWFLWFIRLVWFNQINETNQTNQNNQPVLALHAPRSMAAVELELDGRWTRSETRRGG